MKRDMIDRLEQVDLSALKVSDLAWCFCTGRGTTSKTNRGRVHTYRIGIQTPLGDMDLPIWIQAAEYLVMREGLQEDLEHLRAFPVTPAQNAYPQELAYCKRLEFCLERGYQNPHWSGFFPYNRLYHPELLDAVPHIRIVTDCCGRHCELPEVQYRGQSEMIRCPLCGQWSTFRRLDSESQTPPAVPDTTIQSEDV